MSIFSQPVLRVPSTTGPKPIVVLGPQGWLGSGRKGTVVLDNVNVTQIPEEEEERDSRQESVAEAGPHPGCLKERAVGSCKADFTRFYYRYLPTCGGLMVVYAA
jgi:hypothetical protein